MPHLHACLQRVAEALNLPLLRRAAAVVSVVAEVLDGGGVEAVGREEGGELGMACGGSGSRRSWGMRAGE